MKDIIYKSCGASLLISCGVYGLLATDYSIFSILLFSFGLLAICKLQLLLFTGKCGYIFRDNITISTILLILIVNLCAGYMIGLLFSISPTIYTIAVSKVALWDVTVNYFTKSCFCGIIMFVAVELYKRENILGILYGVPLFILCGFQHSIANIIIMGAARTYNPAIIICIIGNWIGSLLISFLVRRN